MEVTYNVSREDQSRIGLYLITHRIRPAADIILASFALAIFITSLSHKSGPISWTSSKILLEIFSTTALFVGVNVVFLILANYALTQASKDYPTAKRICTTSVSADGIRDLTPEQDQLLAWKDVRSIRYHRGDIYFWKASGSIFVPKSAFEDLSRAEQFYKSAFEFWRNRTTNDTKSSIHTFDLKTRAEQATRSILESATGNQQDTTEKTLWEGKINSQDGSQALAIDATILYLKSLFLLTSLFVVSTRDPLIWQFVSWFWLSTIGIYLFFFLLNGTSRRTVMYMVTNQRILTSKQSGALPTQYISAGASKIVFIEYFDPFARHGGVRIGLPKSTIITDVYRKKPSSPSILITPDDPTATVAHAIATLRNRRVVDLKSLFSGQLQSNPFQEVLNADERILWQGQPERRSFIDESCGLKNGGPTYALLFGWIALLGYLDAVQTELLWEKAAVFLPFVMIAVGLVLNRYREYDQLARSRFYAVTNLRLLLLDRSKARYFAEADIAMIETIKYEESGSGIGSLAFGGRYHNDIVFLFLPEIANVRRIMSDVRHDVADTPIEWVDIVAKRAKTTVGNRIGCWFLVLMMASPLVYLALQQPISTAYTSYYTRRYFAPGLRHYQRSEYAAAVIDLRVATNTTPDAQAPYYLGLALMHEGHSAEARQEFQRAALRAKYGKTTDNQIDAEARAMITQIDAGRTAPATAKSH